VIPKLKNLPEESPVGYYEMLIKCIAKWGWCKELLEMIHEWFIFVINKNEGESAQVHNFILHPHCTLFLMLHILITFRSRLS